MTLLMLGFEAIYLSLGEVLIDLKIHTHHNQSVKCIRSLVLKNIIF